MDDRFKHLLWIGGSPCSGKSTIADRIAAEFGLDVYRCDDAYERHRLIVDPVGQPVFARLAIATCDEIWLRPVATQIAEEIELYREEFELIQADLMTRDVPGASERHGAPGPVVEGAALLPELIAGLNPDPSQVVWIVPTEPFQRAMYAKREWRHDVLRECSDPGRGWENWMARDAGFARIVAAQAARLGYRVIEVDGSRTLDDIYDEVVVHFRLEDRFRRGAGD